MSLKAFVSSTFVDLEYHRVYVISQLRNAGIFVDPMENWTAAADEPKALSVDRIKDCDLCVLLVGFRRGYIPENENLSITQMEFREALRREIPVLVFMASPIGKWKRNYLAGLNKDPSLRKWRKELTASHVISLFTAVPSSINIDASLLRWFNERQVNGVEKNLFNAEKGSDRIEIKTYNSSEGILIVWRCKQPIENCLGFAIRCKVLKDASMTETIINTYINERSNNQVTLRLSPTTKSPIQRFRWIDRPSLLTEVRYRIIPMVGRPGNTDELSEKDGSGWSAWATRKPFSGSYFQLYVTDYPNLSTLISRSLGLVSGKSQQSILQKIRLAGSTTREHLGGERRGNILSLLIKAVVTSQRVYVHISEIDDPDIMLALARLGNHLFIILPSRALNSKLEKIVESSGGNIYRSKFLAKQISYQNYAVFCDHWGAPVMVWTGSGKWTIKSNFLSDNFGMTISSPAFARYFLDKWTTQRDALDRKALKKNELYIQAGQFGLGNSFCTIWNTPVKNQQDILDIKRLIRGARQGILFLVNENSFCKPLQKEINLAIKTGLFIQGISYQTPKGSLQSFTLRDGIKTSSITGDMSIGLESSIIIIDAFGPHPVVITGGHDLSLEVSAEKQSELFIIENARELAMANAFHLIKLYDYFRFRKYNLGVGKDSGFTGLASHDKWQQRFFQNDKRTEFNFLFGLY